MMITGDNTLTGSNISYKCNISDKNKSMIICDFVDGKYTEERFDFQDEQDDTTDITAPNHVTIHSEALSNSVGNSHTL